MLAVACLYFSRQIRETNPDLPGPKAASIKALLPDQYAIECGPDFAAAVWRRTAVEYCVGVGELRPSIHPEDNSLIKHRTLPEPSY